MVIYNHILVVLLLLVIFLGYILTILHIFVVDLHHILVVLHLPFAVNLAHFTSCGHLLTHLGCCTSFCGDFGSHF